MPNNGLDAPFEVRGVGYHQSHLLVTDQKDSVVYVLEQET